MRTWTSKSLAYLIIFSIWAVFLSVLGAIAAEAWLGFQNPDKPWSLKKNEPPIMGRLRTAYRPFMLKHLHPHYLFFFPLEPDEQRKIGNDICSIEPGGFRGSGPEKAGDRKLSFIIGGSTAFGLYASSNEVTIAGHLNTSQKEFFYIDTGVPSWNSTQNLFRLTNELLIHRPKRVIDFEWSNDLRLAQKNYLKGYAFPPGTPECYDRLRAAMDEIIERPEDAKRPPWYTVVFPNLTDYVRRSRIARDAAASAKSSDAKRFQKAPKYVGPRSATPHEVLDEAAEKLAWNFRMMHEVCKAYGAEFFAILHPVASMHKSATEGWGEPYMDLDRVDFPYLRDQVLARLPKGFPIIDLSTCFDRHVTSLKVRNRNADPAPDTIMLDAVHLSDRGNAIAADEIARAIDAFRATSQP